MSAGHLHHVELWVPDLARAEQSIGWLLGELGWAEYQRWPAGVSWRLGPTYMVVEQSPAMDAHHRLGTGLNHLAFHVAERTEVDRLVSAATDHGWSPLFADRYPHAGGPEHYAGYLENTDGFEVELVASSG
ncbi:VOC family protein [Saccharothrix sp. NRRL B-16314]|uniref:VOC family protein n=1 Tax=Saccharothrix sp. NRRL B-16314 TaxID=1463825 RepID=UPI00052683AC|nr:VOC family protein [Saccharothrix sp. NRRL B-16314]